MTPHLYLGKVYTSMYISGSTASEKEARTRSAETEFKRVLEMDATNTTALAALGQLAYQAAFRSNGEDKIRKLDEAQEWTKRLAAADPTYRQVYFSLGKIAWLKLSTGLTAARASLSMRPEDRGPLPNPARQELKAQYSSMIEESIANFGRALEIDPNLSEAMDYTNLLIRERADLRDTKEEYAADIAVADEWVRRSVDAKKAPPQSAVEGIRRAEGGGGGGGRAVPSRIRVGGNVQAANLIRKVAPMYPPEARKAHVAGQVRFTVIIGKDGRIQNIQLVSGDPLLVDAARDAVQQWIYKPTTLDGNPVEVITQVDVNFVLGN